MGDVKLAGVMGLFLGSAVAPALLIALLGGRRRGRRRDRRARAPRRGARRRSRSARSSRSARCVAVFARRSRSSISTPNTFSTKAPRVSAPIPPCERSAPDSKHVTSDATSHSIPPEPKREPRPPRRQRTSSAWTSSPASSRPCRRASTASILAERAAALPLPADTMRDGEVIDGDALAEALRELFAGSGLGKRVRVGVANQRTVLRTLELPPVTDQKELAAAVAFQAQDQVPMPLSNAVLDFHPLGIVDTPAGPRQRVVLVAAQRDMVETPARRGPQRRPDPRGRRPLGLRADPLALPADPEQARPRPLPERRRPHQPRDRRGHDLPLHPRRRQRPRGHGGRARRAPQHRRSPRRARCSPRST